MSHSPYSLCIIQSLLLTTVLTYSHVKGCIEAGEICKKDLRSSFLEGLYLTDDPENPQAQVRQPGSGCISTVTHSERTRATAIRSPPPSPLQPASPLPWDPFCAALHRPKCDHTRTGVMLTVHLLYQMVY